LTNAEVHQKTLGDTSNEWGKGESGDRRGPLDMKYGEKKK